VEPLSLLPPLGSSEVFSSTILLIKKDKGISKQISQQWVTYLKKDLPYSGILSAMLCAANELATTFSTSNDNKVVDCY